LSSRRFEVFLDSKAEKALEKLDAQTQERITEHLRKLQNGFSPDLDIKKLEGKSNYYRLRVGLFRVLFTLRPSNVIIVIAIRPRKTAYKRDS